MFLFDASNGCSSSINEINRLISKGMPKHLPLRKTDVLDFLGKKIWRNALALKSKNVQGIFGETFILALSSSAAFRLESRVSNFF